MLATALTACGDKQDKREGPKVRLDGDALVFAENSPQLSTLTVATVETGVPRSLQIPGRLAWDEDRTVRLYPAFSGRVSRILVKTGDSVKAGQALAILSSPDYGQAQADASRALTDLGLAEKNLSRLRDLYAGGVAARKDLSSAEADFARAQSERERALNRVKLYGGNVASGDQNFAMRSPIAGVVVERNINPGQELRTDLQLANAPAIFVITDPSRLWVQLDATDRDLAAVQAGGSIRLRASAYPDEVFNATIRTVADFVDPATRTIKVRGALDNPGRRLKAEMYVIAGSERRSSATARVSAKALLHDGDRYVAFVQQAPGRFLRVSVRADDSDGSLVDVAAGLVPGQIVVIEGSLLLLRLYHELSASAR